LTSKKRGGSGEASLNLDSPAGRSRVTTGGGFMGKEWDATEVAFKVKTWRAVYRVLRPGGHLVAFGGTRTHHRLMCAIEDAGFEIRDVLMWLYGNGFPKSLDISKAIDKAKGAEREAVEKKMGDVGMQGGHMHSGRESRVVEADVTAPATELAQAFEEYGTALKPAYEPIIWAMKPLDGTFARNAEKWGCGGINVDAGRIEGPKGDGVWGTSNATCAPTINASRDQHDFRSQQHPQGRFPANVLLDETAADMLDRQSGMRTSGRLGPGHTDHGKDSGVLGAYKGRSIDCEFGGDSGGASRFFYTAKADGNERWFFCAECRTVQSMGEREGHAHGCPAGKPWPHIHAHPTQKPAELMEYLLKLFDTPRGGKVIDPFCGSGTTLVAAARLHREAVGIEREPEYAEIARRRVADPRSLRGDRAGRRRKAETRQCRLQIAEGKVRSDE
jgi:site-specific DNA-methyltransferase (adenine-specific)